MAGMSGTRTSRIGRTDDGVREVADGVFMITRALTNSYLVDTDDGLVLVDAGLPRSWPLLLAALAASAPRPTTSCPSC